MATKKEKGSKPVEKKRPAPPASSETTVEKKSVSRKTAFPIMETAIAQPAARPVEKKTTEEKPDQKETSVSAHGIQKEYIDGEKICRVTFRLPKSAAPSGKSVFIVGDFNNWNIHAHQMKRNKNGDYYASLDLASGKEYQFRYLIDESIWENDWNADKYVKNPYGNGDNSVVVV